MNKEELIGRLEMVYVGDKNALNELIGYYDGLKQGIDELQQENKQLKEEIKDYKYKLSFYCSEETYIKQIDELKEVIDRAIEYLETATIDPQSMLHYRNCLLEILKEVE